MESSQNTREYIWVSFSQEDRQTVLPILEEMTQKGICLQWEATQEKRQSMVHGCGYCLVFLSQSYLDSPLCLEELNTTRELEKQHLLIYLEDVQLPQSIAMRIGRNQAIFYNRYRTLDAFLSKVYEAQNIAAFTESGRIQSLPKEKSPQTNVFRRRRYIRIALMILLPILLLGLILIVHNLSQKQEDISPDGTVQTEQKDAGVENTVPSEQEDAIVYTPTAEDTVILDTPNAFAAIRPGTYQEEGRAWVAEVILINRTDQDLRFTYGYDMLNGHAGNTYWQEILPANEMFTDTIRISYLDWLDTGYDRVLSYSGTVTAGEEEATFALFPEGEAAAEGLQVRQSDPTQIVYENNAVRVAYLGIAHYPDFPYPRELFWVQNKLNRKQDVGIRASGMEPDYDVVRLLPQATAILNWSRNDGVTETTLQIQSWNRQFGDYETVTDIHVALEES